MLRTLLRFIPLLLLIALVASLFFWPNIAPWISIAMLALSISLAIFLSARKHWQAYQQAECTREKMVRNLLLDLLGFLLMMGAAMYAGRIVGEYLGLRAGIWAGLMAGFAGGFLAAWVVRFAWGRVMVANEIFSSTLDKLLRRQNET